MQTVWTAEATVRVPSLAWRLSVVVQAVPPELCGGSLPATFHPVAMHWHHLPGVEKTASLGDLAKRGSRKRVLEEIAKCELLCANCHAVRTFLGPETTIPER